MTQILQLILAFMAGSVVTLAINYGIDKIVLHQQRVKNGYLTMTEQALNQARAQMPKRGIR